MVPGRQRLHHPRPRRPLRQRTDRDRRGRRLDGWHSYTTPYANGGHIRVLAPTGNAGQPKPNGGLACQYTTNETVESSPAVGQFLAGSAVGIVAGTGATFNQSNTNQLLALNTSCGLQWTATLNGNTKSSPALADVLGNGQLQVVEGTDNGRSGSVYALNGANGSVAWSTSVGRVIGSVVTADLGSGYQDVLAPTVNGVVVLDGKTGSVITTLQSNTGFQNSPLITKDPNGTIGITLAGYQGSGSFIYHYEIGGSNGSVVNEPGAWPQFHHDAQLTGNAGTPPPVVNVPCTAPAGAPNGYYLSASDGGIFSYGNLPFCGSTGNLVLNQPVVGMAVTRNGGGYWEVAKDGGLFAFGNAPFYGSMGGKPLNQPVVGMAANPNGNGYWEVGPTAGSSPSATPFYGSMGGKPLNQPIVGMAATPDGKGYWLVASDGGLFAFGDAHFYGSMGGKPLNQPVVALAANANGNGYWEVAADGGIFAFGTPPFYGSMGGKPLNQPIVGMQAVAGGSGYRLVAADGGIFAFGTRRSTARWAASRSTSRSSPWPASDRSGWSTCPDDRPAQRGRLCAPSLRWYVSRLETRSCPPPGRARPGPRLHHDRMDGPHRMDGPRGLPRRCRDNSAQRGPEEPRLARHTARRRSPDRRVVTQRRHPRRWRLRRRRR